MNNYCELMENCSMECPDNVDCPYDSVSSEKDLSMSRKRHHNSVKAKERSFVTAKILSAKADKIPESASEAYKKANQRANDSLKRCEKFRKQVKEQENRNIPYKK